MQNKVIPKGATLYCPYCMKEQKVKEGAFNEWKVSLFCHGCSKQISELIFKGGIWRLNIEFYNNPKP